MSLVRAADLVPEDELATRPWPGEHRILVAGRLDPEKNPLLLLDLARSLGLGSPWTIDIAGTGSLRDRLADGARALGGRVQLHDRLDREQLFVLYHAATVFVHVSHTEGVPQVLYEAAAVGLPIVATAVGGVPGALAHGKRGILVPPGDAPAIVRAIARLDAEPEHRVAMVRAAYAWVAGETTDLQVDRVARFIEGVVMANRS